MLWALVSRLETKSKSVGAPETESTTLRRLKASLLILTLVASVLSPLGIGAISVDAAYSTQLTDFDVSFGGLTWKYNQVESGIAWGGIEDGSGTAGAYSLVTVASYGRFYFNAAYNSTLSFDDKFVNGVFDALLVVTWPSIAGFTFHSGGAECIGCSVDQGTYKITPSTLVNSASDCRFRVSFYKYNERPNFGGYVDFVVYSTYRPTSDKADPRPLANYYPSATVSPANASAWWRYSSSLDPSFSALENMNKLFFDADIGYMPTLSLQLQTVESTLAGIASTNGTIASYSNLLYGQSQIANGHLSNIKQEQAYQTGQLQQIVDYVNSTQAAVAVDQANTNFQNNAASLESGQAILEDKADADFDRVDFGGVSIINTYSQSVNWWLRCVNNLPNVVGSVWDVLVFGFLIAFVLFILKLVK